MNIKAELIERERMAYNKNDPALANFFDDTLQYILSLEERINERDKKSENVDEILASVAEARDTLSRALGIK